MRLLYKADADDVQVEGLEAWRLPFSPVQTSIEGVNLWLVQNLLGSIKLEVTLECKGLLLIPESSLRQIYLMLGLEPRIFSEDFEVSVRSFTQQKEYIGWLSSREGLSTSELVRRVSGFTPGIPVQFMSA